MCLQTVLEREEGDAQSIPQLQKRKRHFVPVWLDDNCNESFTYGKKGRENERKSLCVLRWQDEMQPMMENCRGNWYRLCLHNSTQRLYIATVKKDCLSDTNYIYCIYIYTTVEIWEYFFMFFESLFKINKANTVKNGNIVKYYKFEWFLFNTF